MSDADDRLSALGLALPEPAAPAASYVPWRQVDDLLLTSGQLPLRDGALVATGRLGDDVDLETGQEAARHCALNVLAQLQAALGDLDRVAAVVKATVFVAATPDFTDAHLVANGFSDLLADVLAERGRHARSAVAVAALPLGAPVEVEVLAQVRGAVVPAT